eukprot:4103605-Pleurochrysis_carterae.AAC.1
MHEAVDRKAKPRHRELTDAQLRRSAIYCGVTVSPKLYAVGTPSLFTCAQPRPTRTRLVGCA